jgi:hypothetical protein
VIQPWQPSFYDGKNKFSFLGRSGAAVEVMPEFLEIIKKEKIQMVVIYELQGSITGKMVDRWLSRQGYVLKERFFVGISDGANFE